VCPHRCALASQNAQHFQHLFNDSVFKTNHPRLRVLNLTPARADLRGHTSNRLIGFCARCRSCLRRAAPRLTPPQVSETAQKGFGVAVEKALRATILFERPPAHLRCR